MPEFTQKTEVLFLWNVADKIKNYVEEKFSDSSMVKFSYLTDYSKESEESSKLLPKANIIIGWRPRKEWLEKAENMKLYINPGTGVQNLIGIFRELKESRGVTLLNGRSHSRECAQHAVSLLMTFCGKIHLHDRWMRQGIWRRFGEGDSDTNVDSIPLTDRKIGFLGYGAINSKVHKLLSGFNSEFSALRKHWDKQREKPPTPLKKYNFSQLHEFLTEIDTLIIAAPLTTQTTELIKMKELELLGKDGLLVNVGRGLIIHEESLYTALKQKIIAGAGIDVWYNYRPEPDEEGKKYPYSFPFHELDNIVLSPHRAASPMQQISRWDEHIENIKIFAEGREDFNNIVNLEEEY